MNMLHSNISLTEIEDLIHTVADMIGVDHDRLRSRRTIERARCYRHAIWFILSNDFDISQRWMSEYFETSRNTIKHGVNAFKNPDPAHATALKLVRAKLNRLSTGL